jgi:hypothetical protein
MVIWIALLIVLIVAVLFAVYKRVDMFEVSLTGLTDSSKIKELTKIIDNQVTLNRTLKERLEKADEFDETLTEAKLDELALEYTKADDGTLTLKVKPLSKALTTSSQEVSDILLPFQVGMSKYNPDKLMTDIFSEKDVRKNLIQSIDFFQKLLTDRETYVNKKLGKPTISETEIDDLYDAVKGTSTTTDKEEESTEHESAPATSTTSTKEMEERIAKSVATQLKDTLLAQRSVSNPMEDTSCPYATYDSTATAQGKEYVQGKPSTAPDMSEYIRKDSIPCWNCSLP